MLRVGVIADTHDLIRPELLDALAGVELVLHAGDLCSEDTLTALGQLAPVIAVRGNNDRGAWALALPEARAVDLEAVRIWLCHDRADLRRLPPPEGTDLIVVGHSHRPTIDRHQGLPLLNPGSPGRRRFSLPVCCAQLHIDGSRYEIEPITLTVAPGRRTAALR
ncbi:MAG: metallophosphoesterase family protein [Pseudomonadales bacterium]|jgi:putative phosphoesterase|nr:metallophosphoesterase family protein [Pseudomonadales bacterium]